MWPYLLGHYPFGSTVEEREAQDRAMQAAYETTMSEWLAVEAIIRQRDKENTAASIAKLSFRSQSGEQGETQMEGQSRSLSNEVRRCLFNNQHPSIVLLFPKVFDDEASSEDNFENEDGKDEKSNEKFVKAQRSESPMSDEHAKVVFLCRNLSALLYILIICYLLTKSDKIRSLYAKR